VHAFLTAIRLGPLRRKPFGLEVERDPPDTQLREATEGRRGQGRAVIGANRLRPRILAAQPLEDGRGLPGLRGGRNETGALLPTHILPKQQDAIAVLELAIQAMPDAKDGTIDHDLDMLPQLTRGCIPEGTLQLWIALAQTTQHGADGVIRGKG
jgi:hypothetical protein